MAFAPPTASEPGMSTKKRDAVLQQWCGVIRRETRDLARLKQIGERALASSDVRNDPTLRGMISAEIERRRADLEQEQRAILEQEHRDEQSRAATPESRRSGRSRSSGPVSITPSEPVSSPPPEPEPAPPSAQVQEAFGQLVQTLSTLLERGNETETHDVLASMRALQKENPEVIPRAAVAEHERRVSELRVHLRQLKEQIATLSQQAISASRKGREPDLARSMRRLTAIHAAHPRLLDERGLESIRRSIADAATERRDHQLTTQKLLERERALTAEIKTLAAVVRDFHQVACKAPAGSAEFRKAEATYLRAIQKVRTYDVEWFSGVVLDLADLLAEWAVPPPEAEGQIDRFLDSISAGLDCIRAEMRHIQDEHNSDESTESESTAP